MKRIGVFKGREQNEQKTKRSIQLAACILLFLLFLFTVFPLGVFAYTIPMNITDYDTLTDKGDLMDLDDLGTTQMQSFFTAAFCCYPSVSSALPPAVEKK